MSGVAGSAVSNASVIMWFPNRMTTCAATSDRGRPLQPRQCIRWTLDVARMQFLRELYLLGGKPTLTEYRGPRGSRVPASHKFLINLLMADAAVCRCDMCRNLKSIMINLVFLLAFLRLVAIEAGYALRCVLAHLKFMHDGVLLARMALRTFTGGLYKIFIRLVGLNSWPRALN